VSAPATERGSISIAGAVFAFGIVALIGLVLMQGQSLGALSRTREAADNAARAAAQQVDTDHLLTTGQLRLDPDAAAAAARNYATNLGSIVITGVTVDGATVTVTVAETVEPIGPVGGPRTFTATESATALRGVTEVIE
jgi:Flp pilus assembly protein TadG